MQSPHKLLRACILVLRNGASAHGTARVLINKFACIKQNDFARLYSAVPIGKRACLNREDYEFLIFIDGVGAKQCDASATDSLIFVRCSARRVLSGQVGAPTA